MPTTMDPVQTEENIDKRLVRPDDPLAELRKRNPTQMALIDAAKPSDRLLLLRNWDVRDPMEEMCLQIVIDAEEPIEISGEEEAKVRMEMNRTLAENNRDILEPAEEEMWEAKLVAARNADRMRQEDARKSHESLFRQEQNSPTKAGVRPISIATENDPNSLLSMPGLGAKTVAKLTAAGVLTKQAFLALSHEQRQSIVGPLVAAKFNTNI